MNSKHSSIGPHDLGGHHADGVDLSEHEVTFWEQRVDAMVNLLRTKGVLTDWAQLRAGVESLTKEDYERLGYYERWALSASSIAINHGLISADELEQRIQHLIENNASV